MNDLKDRLRAARADAGLTQLQLSRAVGVRQPVISDLEQGKQRSTAFIVKIANVLGVNASWLDSGRGGRNGIDQPLSAADGESPAGPAPEFRLLPVITSVQAGSWGDAIDPFEPGDADSYTPVIGTWSQYAFVLRVEGDSMTNTGGGLSIPHGAHVVVEPEEVARHGDIVVAKLEAHEQATVKKLVIDPPDTYLMPLNPQYDKIIIDEECRIVGVVKQFVVVIRR